MVWNNKTARKKSYAKSKVSKEANIILSDPSKMEITFAYNVALLDMARTLEDKQWHPSRKLWTASSSRNNINKLRDWGFSLCVGLNELVPPTESKEIELPEVSVDLPLRPFQLETLQFIESRNGRALIALEPGMGKTLISIAYLKNNKALRPVLIVVPAVSKINWERELRDKWLIEEAKKVEVLYGRTPYKIRGKICVINYDILPYWEKHILDHYDFNVYIVDEVHMIKEDKPKRTKSVKRLGKTRDHVLALSGTPALSKPIELFNPINLVDKNIFPNRWKFGHRFCDLKNNGFGWDWSGSSNTDELYKILTGSCMVRKLKKDCMKDLPPKNRIPVPLEIDRKKYKKGLKDLDKWLEERFEDNPAIAMVEIEKLKQLNVELKMKPAIQWIENYLANDPKLVVFCTHRKAIADLAEYFGKRCVVVQGGMTAKKKQEAVDAFQTDPKAEVFIGNLQAAGVAITLTAAFSTATMEFSYIVGEHMQAEDRVHRIGQEASSVNAYYLVADDTIDDVIVDVLHRKAKILDQIIDGKSVDDVSVFDEIIIGLNNSRKKRVRKKKKTIKKK